MDTFTVSDMGSAAKVPARTKESRSDNGQHKVLTPEQAAALLQISTKTLLKMANAGQIPAFRAGRLWRFPAAALDSWLTQFA